MKNRLRGLLFGAGFFAGIFALVFVLTGWGQAAGFLRQLEVTQYPVTFYFDGEESQPVASEKGYFNNGKQEVPLSFIYQGTTYVPIRYVSEALGKEVGWDGTTYSVWVGETPARFSDSEEGSQQSQAGQDTKSFDLYGIEIGDDAQRVIERLGNPNRKDASHIGVEWWIYKQDWTRYLQVGIKDQRVVTLYSNGAAWEYDGISMGMTPQQLSAIWGNPQSTLQITERVTMKDNQMEEHVVYKRNGQMILLYLDKYEDNKIRGIRLATPTLFSKTIPTSHAYTFYNRDDVALPPLTPGAREQAEQAYERQIWDITNAIRVKNGLPAFAYHDLVSTIAKSHSHDMYQNQFFSHQSPQTGSPGDRLQQSSLPAGAFGENIAAGYLDAIAAVEGWMNSKGHRDNILNDYADHMGAGVILGENATYRHYFTQNFYKAY